jgi:hypothetical protein
MSVGLFIVSWFLAGLLTQFFWRIIICVKDGLNVKGCLTSEYETYFWSSVLGYMTPTILLVRSIIFLFESKYLEDQ